MLVETIIQFRNKVLAELTPVAMPINNNVPKIETEAINISNNILMEEEVKTPEEQQLEGELFKCKC